MRSTLEPTIAPFELSAPAGEWRGQVYEVRRSAGEGPPLALSVDGRRIATGYTAEQLLRTFTWDINRRVIEKSVAHHTLLHAAVAHQAGATVLLPGDQEHGKTTTVAGLLRAGFDYVTDEAAALQPGSGAVKPFPKRLSLDQGSWSLFPELAPFPHRTAQRHVAPRELGAGVVDAIAPAPLVVAFPRYVEGATTRFERVTPGEAVVKMAQCCFSFPVHTRRNLEVLQTVASQAIAGNLVIGELDAAVNTIIELTDLARARTMS